MNKFALTLSLILLAGVALAAGAQSADPQAAPPPAQSQLGSETRAESVDGEVVSTDVTGKTITIKSGMGANRTLAVDTKALTSLKNVKIGDKVTLKMSNNAVTEIKTKSENKPGEPPTN